MPFTKRRATSPSATPERTGEGPSDGSQLPAAQWDAMQEILNYIYDYRTADGYDPSKVFHRKVNKRVLPVYYEVIAEPMALSTIKQKLNNRAYKTFAEFVRDFALIPHNAQVYNRPDAGAYQDALLIKDLLVQQFQKLADQKLISQEEAALPDLGEIPPADDLPPEEDEEEDDDEDEEDDEADEELGEEAPKKRRRGRPRRSSIVKRDGPKDDKADDPETRKKRGRPPKVLTPTENRIQAVLKGLRRPKNREGLLKISHFERLPDKAVMPEYFTEIKYPMAYDVLKRKYKRKKYRSLDEFMRDVHLMFENAKLYNTDESQIYRDAVELQVEAQRLAQEEMAKPDSEYPMEEGRIPIPEGILHNGELYRVGDWVLIQNQNDLTKPIPTQIYRTWQGTDGTKWVNACWYYRPEQTVHRFDKHFLENEAVKTGQYRDHRVDEIVGRCFIMFVTRYYKGRPRGLPRDMDVFVCEARYNEEKLTFNKIKTWASCLPDEVRDKDYEMDLFDAPRKMKKFPSPIAYLLKDEQKETDDLPKPEWGADNAPPKIGAVHRRPRDQRDSLPPEPTPEPPAQPPQPVAAPMRPSAPIMSSPNPGSAQMNMPPQANMSSMTAQSPVQQPASIQRPSFTPSHPNQYPQTAGSPGPMQYSQQRQSTPSQRPTYPSSTPQQNLNGQMTQFRNTIAPQPPTQPSQPSAPTNPYLRPPTDQDPSSASYRGPPPIEVYTLPDAANASIPPEIRNQFQRDEAGRVLFFTAPPVHLNDRVGPVDDRDALSGHSIKYQAEKLRSREDVARRRREYEERKAQALALKRKRAAEQESKDAAEFERVKRRALNALEDELADAVNGDLKALYGDSGKVNFGKDLNSLARKQRETMARNSIIDRRAREREQKVWVPMGVGGILPDE